MPDFEYCPETAKGDGQRHLLLAPQHCTLCEEYRDCSACTQVQCNKNLFGLFWKFCKLTDINNLIDRTLSVSGK